MPRSGSLGKEPKGDGFELDVQARIDTGRWLEVTGTVRVHEGMAIVQAGLIQLAEPAEKADPPRRVERKRGPPPEVIFSAPLEGDTDVALDTRVRIQFSRHMDAESFDGRVQVEYPNASVPTEDEGTGIEFVAEYRGGNRRP